MSNGKYIIYLPNMYGRWDKNANRDVTIDYCKILYTQSTLTI